MGEKVDGADHPLLVTERESWRRVVFDSPERAVAQLMDDSYLYFTSSVELEKKSVTLKKQGDAKWEALLRVEQTAPGRMTLSGKVDDRDLEMRLELFPRENYLLVKRGFNWVQEYPFNR